MPINWVQTNRPTSTGLRKHISGRNPRGIYSTCLCINCSLWLSILQEQNTCHLISSHLIIFPPHIIPTTCSHPPAEKQKKTMLSRPKIICFLHAEANHKFNLKCSSCSHNSFPNASVSSECFIFPISNQDSFDLITQPSLPQAVVEGYLLAYYQESQVAMACCRGES